MHTAQPKEARSAGALSARILLAIAAIAGALALTVVGADPAGAYTIERNPDEVVIRSERLDSNQTHATVIATFHSNGDYSIRVEAHNTARTRKFVLAWADVRSPATDISFDMGFWECRRVDSGEWDEWERPGWSAKLESRWDEFVNDPDLSANLSMAAYRTSC